MNEAAIHNGLDELKEILTNAPRPAGGRTLASDGLYVPCSSARRPSLEEALDHLRVMVKYAIFDLEATRRENRYLRQMLETRLRQDRDDDRDTTG